MSRHSLDLLRKTLLLATTVLAACMPAWGARAIEIRVAHALRATCCTVPEPPSCCARTRPVEGPVYAPLCCGIGARPDVSPAPVEAPRLQPGYTAERLLAACTQAAQSNATTLAADAERTERPGCRVSDPGPAPEPAGSRSAHWLTDRETCAALAWLSIARI